MEHDANGTQDADREARRRRGGLPLGIATGFVAGALVTGAGAAWAGHQFSDVPDTHPFHKEIDWMVDQGIADGYADGTYKPANPVSRQAYAAFLQRYNDRLQMVSSASEPPNNSSWLLSVDCPAGLRVFGGGGRTTVANVVTSASYPLDANTWRVTFVSRDGSTIDPGQLTVYAYCVPE